VLLVWVSKIDEYCHAVWCSTSDGFWSDPFFLCAANLLSLIRTHLYADYMNYGSASLDCLPAHLFERLWLVLKSECCGMADLWVTQV